MIGQTIYADLPRVYTRDGLEAYATVTRPGLLEQFPWMTAIGWTAHIPDGPFLFASGKSAEDAIANWRSRHGDPARFVERLAA